MNPAWRGVVVDGVVWAWPTLLMDHEQAFRLLPHLREYTCRWRQWSPGSEIDFDAGASPADRERVYNWIEAPVGRPVA